MGFGSFLGSIAPIAGTAIGGYFGGPAGAQIGGSIGSAIGGQLTKPGDPEYGPKPYSGAQGWEMGAHARAYFNELAPNTNEWERIGAPNPIGASAGAGQSAAVAGSVAARKVHSDQAISQRQAGVAQRGQNMDLQKAVITTLGNIAASGQVDPDQLSNYADVIQGKAASGTAGLGTTAAREQAGAAGRQAGAAERQAGAAESQAKTAAKRIKPLMKQAEAAETTAKANELRAKIQEELMPSRKELMNIQSAQQLGEFSNMLKQKMVLSGWRDPSASDGAIAKWMKENSTLMQSWGLAKSEAADVVKTILGGLGVARGASILKGLGSRIRGPKTGLDPVDFVR